MTVARVLRELAASASPPPRTTDSNVERTGALGVAVPPAPGEHPDRRPGRAMLRDVLAALLKRGLAKGTIDGAFASFSAMLTDAVDDELIEVNPARSFRVEPTDPRLKPKLPPRDRRALPPAEVGAFMSHVDPRWRALCWAPSSPARAPASCSRCAAARSTATPA